MDTQVIQSLYDYQFPSNQDLVPGYLDPTPIPSVAQSTFSSPPAPEEESIRPEICVRTLAGEILATLVRNGCTRKPSIPALLAIVLSWGHFRSHEIREIIREMFPDDYRGKKEYGRLVENVKHNLTRCKCFVQMPRARGMAGKGGLWRYDPSVKRGRTSKIRKPASKSRTRRVSSYNSTSTSSACSDAADLSQVDESFGDFTSGSSNIAVHQTDVHWTAASSGVDHYPSPHTTENSHTSYAIQSAPFTLHSAGPSQQWLPLSGTGSSLLAVETSFTAQPTQPVQYFPTDSSGHGEVANVGFEQLYSYAPTYEFQ